MDEKIEVPEGLRQEHLDYLDGLRESGVTNMFGARPYLCAEFGMKKEKASKILSYWMKTFSARHPLSQEEQR